MASILFPEEDEDVSEDEKSDAGGEKEETECQNQLAVGTPVEKTELYHNQLAVQKEIFFVCDHYCMEHDFVVV